MEEKTHPWDLGLRPKDCRGEHCCNISELGLCTCEWVGKSHRDYWEPDNKY